MLTHLIVQNFALADHIELAFDGGMSVITGETGAGKSILLNALGLALGDRADTGAIAAGTDRAEISATFDISRISDARSWLADRELDADDECILRRTVSRDGRSRGYINGTQVTVKDLKALGDMLIDIHSQHEHQSLLKRDTHRRLLDEYADTRALASEVESIAQKFQQTAAELGRRSEDSEEMQARVQLLTYQVDELSALAITAGETEKLEEEQRRLSGAESIINACRVAVDACAENDEINALTLIGQAISALREVDLKASRDIVDMLESSRIQLQEAAGDIARLESDIELDPARLELVESRLDDIYQAARKHRVEPDTLPGLQEELAAELESLGNSDEEIARLGKALEALRSDYDKAAAKLTKARARAADNLIAAINEQLGQLGMGGARFDVALEPRGATEIHAAGREQIEFLISTNPGQPPRSLNRIASGGELSRISLAIQVVTADTSDTPTLVFDEVDVGIGGAVAEVVGTLLRRLGQKAQIVCVTHLPQVAAQGHHHFRVIKASGGDTASTSIEALSPDEKVEEIARMLGGKALTEQTLAHASEMFQAAQSNQR